MPSTAGRPPGRNQSWRSRCRHRGRRAGRHLPRARPAGLGRAGRRHALAIPVGTAAGGVPRRRRGDEWDLRDGARLPALLEPVRPTRVSTWPASARSARAGSGRTWSPRSTTPPWPAARRAGRPASRRGRQRGAGLRGLVRGGRTRRQPLRRAKRAAESTSRRRGGRALRVLGRLHNHESPLRERRFVTRKITCAAAEIALGGATRLTLGTLTVRRDWGHARDLVEGMRLMLELDSPADLEIGTGVAHTLDRAARRRVRRGGARHPAPYLEQDAGLLGPPTPRAGGRPRSGP